MDTLYTTGIETPFINFQSDFGFKKAFGSEKHKDVPVEFIDALFFSETSAGEVGRL